MTIDVELTYLSAADALTLFRDRALSPVELLDAQIVRAEVVEPLINAFSDTFFDDARSAARDAERRYVRGRPRPLDGLTLAVKETMDVEGQRTTHGSLIHRDTPVAQRSEPMVERLVEAGAIIHARTTSPEFATALATTSRLNGVTRTPWDLAYTCGGSSGGSGASVAAGTTSLATGSDQGGSIRAPAAACGVIGYKPPYGRVPQTTPSNLDPSQHVGPLTRTVADCALALNVIAGPHPLDIATLRERVRLPTAYPDIRGWRIAWTLDVGNRVVAEEVERSTHEALAALVEQGATVEEVQLGWGEEVTRATKALFNHLSNRWLVRICDEHPDLVCDYTKWYASQARDPTGDALPWANEVAARMYNAMGPLLEDYHALVCPTLATHEIRADQMPWERVDLGGLSLDIDYDVLLMHPFNLLSRLPVMAVPSNVSNDRLPSSIQIVGRSFDDGRVFQVAAALERARPWLDRADRRPALSEAPER